MEQVAVAYFDVIILDVDMGSGVCGFECAKLLRKPSYMNFIHIHPNRGFLEYQNTAVDAGANLFIPKPMSKKAILKVLLSRFGNPDYLVSKSGALRNQQEKHTKNFPKLNLIVVDDETIFLRSWAIALKDQGVTSFQCAKEAIAYFKTEPNVDALIVDFLIF